MKKPQLASRKFVAMFLIFTLIFSLFPPLPKVSAAAADFSIRYERIRVNGVTGTTVKNKLTIYGSGLDEPKVKAGDLGEIPIPINTALSDEDQIVIDDQNALDLIEGKNNIIRIFNKGNVDLTEGATGIPFDLRNIPSVTSLSTSKVYIDEPLAIDGMGFDGLNRTSDKLYISKTEYNLAASNTNIGLFDKNRIEIVDVAAPVKTGVSDVTIIRNLGSVKYQIISTLQDSITVVDKLDGITIKRIDPNSGPQNKRNIVSIYGTSVSQSNFSPSMRIFVKGKDGKPDIEGTNMGTIKDGLGAIIGLKIQLPIYTDTAGVVDLLLTNIDLSSELLIPNGFIFLNIGNSLTVENVSPNNKKETEVKPATITGRNIGYFDPSSYDKLTGVTYDVSDYAVSDPIDTDPGYRNIPGHTRFDNPNVYKVKYRGTYDGNPVFIIREISVFIDGAVKITAIPTFTKSKDTIVVNPADVNLNPNEPKQVDVTIKTTTTIVHQTNLAIDPYYARVEEDTIINGYTFIPDELAPDLTSITPEAGPAGRDIYVTIKGKDFQVLENGTGPTVSIGSRQIPSNMIKVYDNENRLVDGTKYQLGTKLKFILPAGTESPILSGAVDVVVRNPSLGQDSLSKGFTFVNPSPATRPSNKMPTITTVKEAYADIKGGVMTGERVVITGNNFDTALEGDHMVTITIDGEKATIVGKVSADGKTVTIIPPPGTVEGMTKLQLINKDGSMTEENFEYKRAVTAPKITKIVPIKGGNGTKLVIKGEDFLLPDMLTQPDDPRRKGTVVLLGGYELNAYNYQKTGSVFGITDPLSDNPDRGIYYYNSSYDPDGTGPIQPFALDGKMVTVVDSNTIYVDIPSRFYSLDTTAAAAPYIKSSAIPLGDLSVEVLNPDGAKSKENMIFTYLNPGTKPTITSLTPANGSVNGGTIVTIQGTEFKQDDLKVYFGSEEAKEVEFINTTLIRVQVPIYPYEIPNGKDRITVPVMVMNYDGSMAVADEKNPSPNAKGFEYRIPGSKPVITSLSPGTGTAAGGENIVIRGTDFRRDPNNLVSPNPKVYFNGVEAEVSWIDDEDVAEVLVVKTPPSTVDGPVDVTIVNYDSGSFIYKSFRYEVSKPTISSVTPGVINKSGGAKVQINGTNFKKGDMKKLLELPLAGLPAGSNNTIPSEQIRRNTTSPIDAATQIDTLVIFGDVASGDKKAIDTVVGPKFVELNDIRVDYTKVDDGTANIKLSKTSTPSTPFRSLDIPVGSAHLFIVNGTQDLGDNTIGDEGILVEITLNQAIVTRRVAPFARWENSGTQVTALAPAVASINSRGLYVRNNDGGTANSTINVMSPASAPTISYISPRNKVKRVGNQIVDYTAETANDLEYYTYTPLNGGAFVTITGTDFRKNVKVYMGNQLLEIVSRGVNDDQLVVKVPKGTEADLDKLQRILVVNEDGASADSSMLSRPHYIVYKLPQSSPIIEYVTPFNTSSRGENTIKIIGNDFREGVKVFIDGVESTSVVRIDDLVDKKYMALAVRVPLGITPGKKLVQVMNPDYGFAEKKDAVNILSSPEIDSVYDVVKNKQLSPILFTIDGNQKIRLSGRDFMEGAKVIIGGTLKPKSELKPGESGPTGYNINDVEMVIVGGTEATNVKIEGNNILTCNTPKLKIGKTSIVVINKDGGISNVLEGDYQKPLPDSPIGVTVEVVDSDTIKLEWNKVDGTNYYEIFAAYSATGPNYSNYIYLGSVEAYEVSPGRLRYYIDGLKPNSWYSFKLKSVNDYGPSTLSPASASVKTKDKKMVTFYIEVGDYESGIPQADKVNVLGSSMIYSVGEKSIGNYGTGLVVYFNQTNYVGYDPKSVEISVQMLKKYPNNNITINEKDFTIKMLSNNLLVNEAKAISAAKLPDSKMSVVINKQLKAKGDEIRLKIPRGYKAVTNPVGINVTMQVEQGKRSIKTLSGNATIVYNINDLVRNKYRGGIYVAYYNNTTKKLELLKADATRQTLTIKTARPGEYMLVGKLTK